MPPTLPLLNQRPTANQDLLRPQQSQMSDDEIRTERKRLIDERFRRGGIDSKGRDSYYERYGIVDPQAKWASKEDVAGVERYVEGPNIRERVFPGVEKPSPKKEPTTAQQKYEAKLSYNHAINAAIMAGVDIEWKDDAPKFGKMNPAEYEQFRQTIVSYGYEPVTKERKGWGGKISMEVLGIQPYDVKRVRGAVPAKLPAEGAERAAEQLPPPIAPVTPTELPEGVTWEDVKFTAEQEGMTEDEVLERLRSGG